MLAGLSYTGLAAAFVAKEYPDSREAVRAREDVRPLEGRDRVPAIRGAARVLRPSSENTSGDLAGFYGAPSPNAPRARGVEDAFRGSLVSPVRSGGMTVGWFKNSSFEGGNISQPDHPAAAYLKDRNDENGWASKNLDNIHLTGFNRY